MFLYCVNYLHIPFFAVRVGLFTLAVRARKYDFAILVFGLEIVWLLFGLHLASFYLVFGR